MGRKFLSQNWHIFGPWEVPMTEIDQYVDQRLYVIPRAKLAAKQLVVWSKVRSAFEGISSLTHGIQVHCKSEIYQNDLVVFVVSHNILGLQVIVDQSTIMHDLKSLKRLQSYGDNGL